LDFRTVTIFFVIFDMIANYWQYLLDFFRARAWCYVVRGMIKILLFYGLHKINGLKQFASTTTQPNCQLRRYPPEERHFVYVRLWGNIRNTEATGRHAFSYSKWPHLRQCYSTTEFTSTTQRHTT